MRYYIIAGEPSGDLHGAKLIAGLRKADPNAEFRFWGGDKMAETSGISPFRHYKEGAVMGFWEVFKKLGSILSSIAICKSDIRNYNPDVLILIDYPGFNLQIAKFAHDKGIKVHYYIAPKVWAWKEHRVKTLRRYVDELFVIFPFEIDYFKKRGIEVHYFGNPLMDSIKERNSQGVNSFDAAKPMIALVAGSRKMEIEYNLPYMVQVAQAMPEYQFVVTAVSWLDKKLYDKYLVDSNVTYVVDKTYDVICRSQAALVTSGTATLETALLDIPQVVCYRASAISVWIARRFVKLSWVSLVNLIMNREVVKELLQDDFTVNNAISELKSVLPRGEKQEQMKNDYIQLQNIVGKPGASERVAQKIYEIIKR